MYAVYVGGMLVFSHEDLSMARLVFDEWVGQFTNPDSIAYGSHISIKQNGEYVDSYCEVLDIETGNYADDVSEYARMSM